MYKCVYTYICNLLLITNAVPASSFLSYYLKYPFQTFFHAHACSKAHARESTIAADRSSIHSSATCPDSWYKCHREVWAISTHASLLLFLVFPVCCSFLCSSLFCFSSYRLCEIIAGKRLEGHLQQGYAIYDFNGTLEQMHTYLDLDAHLVMTARMCDPADAGKAAAMCAAVPEEKLLLASNAPWAK